MKRLACSPEGEEGIGKIVEDLMDTKTLFTGTDVGIDIDYEPDSGND